MMRTPVQSVLCALGVFVTGVSAQGADSGSADPPIIAEFDVANDGDALMVNVMVKGKPYVFVVDTCCPLVLYDSSFRSMLGQPYEIAFGSTAAGTVRCEVYKAPSAFLGTLDLRGPEPIHAAPVVCDDLAGIRAALEVDVRGIMGWSFLRYHVFTIDPDRGKLSFRREASRDAGVRVPIEFRGYYPQVRAELPGLGRTMFMIDTGRIGGTGSFGPTTAKSLKALKLLTDVGVAETADFVEAHSRKDELVRIPSLTIAGFHHADLIFGQYSEDGEDVLGLGFWARYVATFDFARRSLYLKPSKTFSKRDLGILASTNRVGVWVGRSNDRPVITKVLPRSAASAAGVHRSDVLLAVDGTDVRRHRLFSIDKLFLTAGDTMLLTVRRDRRKLVLRLRLPRLGPPQPIDGGQDRARVSESGKGAGSR